MLASSLIPVVITPTSGILGSLLWSHIQCKFLPRNITIQQSPSYGNPNVTARPNIPAGVVGAPR
ncbi:hypothetical protein P691DRAFT_170434 [Macrolepiota fuliginosa MF-IS2]|uniref:Uncharacterized protein n=1 Tax=Macrolepiota fuliginosa MF-IS2 TaxID=1400762 RepID=A0A9P6BZV5_9AGAR|nr:hypothetical protein P691DRAFT_170434 [Macrolepiota fuliginosa MF-IS2]